MNPSVRLPVNRRRLAVGLAVLCGINLAPPAVQAAQVVQVSPAQEKALGLRTAVVATSASDPIAVLPGQFVRPPSGRSVVAAPFAGTVVEVQVLEGQAVKPGQVLAVVFSRAALDETASLGQARADAAVAAATAARTRQLADEGIVAGARASEAEARAAAARALLGAKSVSVRAANVGSGGRYTLRAPFAGVVADVQVAAGQGVEAMATAFVVDRQDRIQVEAALPAALAGRLATGARAVIEGAEGRVVAVGVEIDPKTRSVTVRAEVPPRPGFIPGRATRLELFDAAASASLSVPRGAVTTLGDANVVFLRSGAGFTPVPVTVKGWSGDRAMIAGALKPGAVVAVSAISELKAKAQAE